MSGPYFEIHRIVDENGTRDVQVEVDYDPDIKVKEIIGFNVRTKRNGLLKETDWTQVADAPVNKELWSIYRQALRDIPQQAGFPETIVWPTAPGA